MDPLLTAPQLDLLLHLLTSSRPFHVISESFHSSFERSQRFKAAIATLYLLQEGGETNTITNTQANRNNKATEENKEEDDQQHKHRLGLSSSSSSSSSLLFPSAASSSLLSLSSVLRPPHRLSALFVLYDFCRPDSSTSNTEALYTPQQAQALLLTNPFLELLLQHVDSLEHTTTTAPTTIAAGNKAAAASIDPLACERQFVIRLLLHHQLAHLRVKTAKEFIDSYKPDRFSTQAAKSRPKTATQSSSALSSELANLLAPLRAHVHARQPPPRPYIHTYTTAHTAKAAHSASDDHSANSSALSISTGSSAPLSIASLWELTQKAQKASLSSTDRNLVIHTLTTNTQATQALIEQGFTPEQLPALVEKNPSIAVAFLQSALALPFMENMMDSIVEQSALSFATASAGSSYLSALLSMELSLHSMEVVNRLTSIGTPPVSSPTNIATSSTTTGTTTTTHNNHTGSPPSSHSTLAANASASLPSDFLHLYIIHSLSCCKQLRDKYLQTRLVRLVCVFLQSLLRAERRVGVAGSDFGLDGLLTELMSFCVEFSKVKEAAQLYRMLKEWEQQS